MCRNRTQKRKQIEECFDWMKDTGLMRKLQPGDKKLVNQLFLFTTAAYHPSQDETIIGVVGQKFAQRRESEKLTHIQKGIF